MKGRMNFTIAALIVVTSVLAFGASMTVDIGFPFMAGNKSFPAGKYTVEIVDPNVITISAAGERMTLEVLTRLGRRGNDTSAELVFDKVGDQSLLSEVWPAGGGDGYLVLSTKGAHTHAVVGAPKK